MSVVNGRDKKKEKEKRKIIHSSIPSAGGFSFRGILAVGPAVPACTREGSTSPAHYQSSVLVHGELAATTAFNNSNFNKLIIMIILLING